MELKEKLRQILKERYGIENDAEIIKEARFNTKTGHAITPKDTVIYENLVRMEYLNQCGETKFPDDAMLDMRIKAYYTIPPSRPKKKKELMRAGIIRPTKKPDMDNCIKIIADGGKKI